jgi:hypothetical protein
LRRMALVATLLIFSPAAGAADGPPPPSQRPVAGVVNAVDPGSRTLTVGREEFVVPKDVYDLSSLAPGKAVIVHWQQRGRSRVATQVEYDPSGD